MIDVEVRNNNVERAIRRLKKVLNREGIFKEMRERRYYEKPFIKRMRKQREAIRRTNKEEWRRKINS